MKRTARPRLALTLTRREFLGTREDFQRIDSNGDGVITPDEAERADESFRKAKAEARKP